VIKKLIGLVSHSWEKLGGPTTLSKGFSHALRSHAWPICLRS